MILLRAFIIKQVERAKVEKKASKSYRENFRFSL